MSEKGSERARVELLGAVFGEMPQDHVLCGIGDDAAILAPTNEPYVWTVDTAVEGIHFRRDWIELVDLGYRATMTAASDLAAMGARPIALLSSLILPPGFSDEDLQNLAQGQQAACRELGTSMVGGNLSRGGELSITVTALGCTRSPLRRDGAQVGDTVAVAGSIGLAAAGLALLERGMSGGGSKFGAKTDVAQRAIQAFCRPTAQVDAGLAASQFAHAAVDISDGLACDLGHLARASGVRVVLNRAALVSEDLAAVASELGADPLELALYGGEDYALVVAGPGRLITPKFAAIGSCEPPFSGVGDVILDDGSAVLGDRGFDHFAAQASGTKRQARSGIGAAEA